MYRKLISPIFIQWEVTPNCNYKCIHCYNAWRREEPLNGIEINYSKITEEIIQSKALHVTITGGEPLSQYTQLLPCINELIKNKVSVSINTNASLATKEISNELRYLGVSSVLVSLVSGNEKNCNLITQNANSYQLTLEGIENLCNAGLNVSINMVITKLNIQNIYDTAKLVNAFPIKRFSATKASTPCNYSEFTPYRISYQQLTYLFNELLRVKKDFNLNVGTSEFYPYCVFENEQQFKQFGTSICSAGKTEIAIGYDGLIRACPHSNLSYGHYSDGILNAWNKMEIWRTDDNIPLKCYKCKYAYKCFGGCKEEAFNAFGTYSLPDPFAQYERQVYFKNDYQNIDILDDYEYFISEHLKMRKETAGFLIYTRPSEWMLVSDSFANYIINHKTLSVKAISKIHSYNEAKKVMKNLLKKNIIFERIDINE